MYGPDATFAGVPAADLEEPDSYAAAAVILGAPFDGGTSHRPGCRFGPQAIRLTDYLPHDGQRPIWLWAWTPWSSSVWSTPAMSRCCRARSRRRSTASSVPWSRSRARARSPSSSVVTTPSRCRT